MNKYSTIPKKGFTEIQDFKNELAELLAKYDLIVCAETNSASTISEFIAYRSRDRQKFALGQGLVSPIELADNETLRKLGFPT